MQSKTNTNQNDPDAVVFQESLSDEEVEVSELVESNLTLYQLASVGRKKEEGWISLFLLC